MLVPEGLPRCSKAKLLKQPPSRLSRGNWWRYPTMPEHISSRSPVGGECLSLGSPQSKHLNSKQGSSTANLVWRGCPSTFGISGCGFFFFLFFFIKCAINLIPFGWFHIYCRIPSFTDLNYAITNDSSMLLTLHQWCNRTKCQERKCTNSTFTCVHDPGFFTIPEHCTVPIINIIHIISYWQPTLIFFINGEMKLPTHWSCPILPS